jgi:hypothetical protein
MWIVDQLPGFIAGAVVAAIASFFIWRNNPALMDNIYRQVKAEFDEKEKKLRAEIDDLKLEEKVKAVLAKMGVKV